jgi:hypothetical protein
MLSGSFFFSHVGCHVTGSRSTDTQTWQRSKAIQIQCSAGDCLITRLRSFTYFRKHIINEMVNQGWLCRLVTSLLGRKMGGKIFWEGIDSQGDWLNCISTLHRPNFKPSRDLWSRPEMPENTWNHLVTSSWHVGCTKSTAKKMQTPRKRPYGDENALPLSPFTFVQPGSAKPKRTWCVLQPLTRSSPRKTLVASNCHP